MDEIHLSCLLFPRQLLDDHFDWLAFGLGQNEGDKQGAGKAHQCKDQHAAFHSDRCQQQWEGLRSDGNKFMKN
jgi:hypothetical protein